MRTHDIILPMSMLTENGQREIEEALRLRMEAVELLCAVVAEWNSDPLSVQCFDARIVERAKHVTSRLKKLDVFGGQ